VSGVNSTFECATNRTNPFRPVPGANSWFLKAYNPHAHAYGARAITRCQFWGYVTRKHGGCLR